MNTLWSNRPPLKRLPDDTDFLEQIDAASEVTGFNAEAAATTKSQ